MVLRPHFIYGAEDWGIAMSYRLPPLVWLRAFEAAARHASFTAAAQELGLTQAAVSHQIRSLEQHLGYPLFERLPRQLRLTEMGRAYLAPVRKAFDELSAATAGLFGPVGEASLNLRVPVSFAVLWLSPRLPEFCEAFPSIRVRLYSAIWADALPADKVDVDIRFGHGNWSGFRSELIFSDPSVPVSPIASPVRAPAQIKDENLIHIMGLEEAWSELYRRTGLEVPAHRHAVTVDTSLAALELVAAGFGHTIVLRCFAERYIEAGRVRRSFDIELSQEHAHYFLFREDTQALKPEVRLFRDWIMDQARAARVPDRKKAIR
ncbi:MAG: LysR substrate-binding domain-containing protein [Pseudomonadota bacterium]